MVEQVATAAKPVVDTVAEKAAPVVEQARPHVQKAATAAQVAFDKAVDFIELKTGRDLDGDGFIGAVPDTEGEVPVEQAVIDPVDAEVEEVSEDEAEVVAEEPAEVEEPDPWPRRPRQRTSSR